jgi:hypothetical protein
MEDVVDGAVAGFVSCPRKTELDKARETMNRAVNHIERFILFLMTSRAILALSL